LNNKREEEGASLYEKRGEETIWKKTGKSERSAPGLSGRFWECGKTRHEEKMRKLRWRQKEGNSQQKQGIEG